jgi:hypothetical protein
VLKVSERVLTTLWKTHSTEEDSGTMVVSSPVHRVDWDSMGRVALQVPVFQRRDMDEFEASQMRFRRLPRTNIQY